MLTFFADKKNPLEQRVKQGNFITLITLYFYAHLDLAVVVCVGDLITDMPY